MGGEANRAEIILYGNLEGPCSFKVVMHANVFAIQWALNGNAIVQV